MLPQVKNWKITFKDLEGVKTTSVTANSAHDAVNEVERCNSDAKILLIQDCSTSNPGVEYSLLTL